MTLTKNTLINCPLHLFEFIKTDNKKQIDRYSHAHRLWKIWNKFKMKACKFPEYKPHLFTAIFKDIHNYLIYNMVRLKVLLICIVSQIVLTWRKIRSDMDMNIQEWIVRACWWICWAVAYWIWRVQSIIVWIVFPIPWKFISSILEANIYSCN